MQNFHRNVKTFTAEFIADMASANSALHEFDVARLILDIEFNTISVFCQMAHPARWDRFSWHLRPPSNN